MMKRLALSLLLSCLLVAAANAANRFGVCTAACTWDASSTAMWSTTTGGATGASVPTSADAVIFDGATCVGGVTCTITVNTSFTISSLTMGACTASTTGCILDFSANNNSPSMATFSITGSGTRNLKLGSGTFTITGTAGNVWDATTTTNLTFSAGTSTLSFSGTTTPRTFSSGTGPLTYSTVAVGGITSPGTFIFSGSTMTIGTLNITAPASIGFPTLAAMTVTNAPAWTGTSSSLLDFRSSATPSTGTQASVVLTNGSPTAAWAAFYNISFTGQTLVATNSFNLGRIAGATITAPVVGSGGGCILGGWLLWRDMPGNLNDNFPAWLEKAA